MSEDGNAALQIDRNGSKEEAAFVARPESVRLLWNAKAIGPRASSKSEKERKSHHHHRQGLKLNGVQDGNNFRKPFTELATSLIWTSVRDHDDEPP